MDRKQNCLQVQEPNKHTGLVETDSNSIPSRQEPTWGWPFSWKLRLFDQGHLDQVLCPLQSQTLVRGQCGLRQNFRRGSQEPCRLALVLSLAGHIFWCSLHSVIGYASLPRTFLRPLQVRHSMDVRKPFPDPLRSSSSRHRCPLYPSPYLVPLGTPVSPSSSVRSKNSPMNCLSECWNFFSHWRIFLARAVFSFFPTNWINWTYICLWTNTIYWTCPAE